MNSFLSNNQCLKCSEYANQISILKKNYNDKIYGLNTDNHILKVQIEKLLKNENDSMQINKDEIILKQKIELLIKSNESLSKENKSLQLAKNKSTNVCASCNQSIRQLHNQVTQSEFFKNNSDDILDREFNCNMESVYKNYLKLESTLQRERKWYQEVNENHQKVIFNLEELKSQNFELKDKLETYKQKIKDLESKHIINNEINNDNQFLLEKEEKIKPLTKGFDFVDKIKKSKFFKNNKKTISKIEKLLCLIPNVPSTKFIKIDMNEILLGLEKKQPAKFKSKTKQKISKNKETIFTEKKNFDDNDMYDPENVDNIFNGKSDDEKKLIDNLINEKVKVNSISSKNKSQNSVESRVKNLSDSESDEGEQIDSFKNNKNVMNENIVEIDNETDNIFNNIENFISMKDNKSIDKSIFKENSNKELVNSNFSCDKKSLNTDIDVIEPVQPYSAEDNSKMLVTNSHSKLSKDQNKSVNKKRTTIFERSKHSKRSKLDNGALSKEFIDSSDSDSSIDKKENPGKSDFNQDSFIENFGIDFEINDNTFNFDSGFGLPITVDSDEDEVNKIEKQNLEFLKEKNNTKIIRNLDKNYDSELRKLSIDNCDEVKNHSTISPDKVKLPNKIQSSIGDNINTKDTEKDFEFSHEQLDFNFTDQNIVFDTKLLGDSFEEPVFNHFEVRCEENPLLEKIDNFNYDISKEYKSIESANTMIDISPMTGKESLKEYDLNVIFQNSPSSKDLEIVIEDNDNYSFNFETSMSLPNLILGNIDFIDEENEKINQSTKIIINAHDSTGTKNNHLENQIKSNENSNCPISDSSLKDCRIEKLNFSTNKKLDTTSEQNCSESVSDILDQEYLYSLTVPDDTRPVFNFNNDLSNPLSVTLGNVDFLDQTFLKSDSELHDNLFHLPTKLKQRKRKKSRKKKNQTEKMTKEQGTWDFSTLKKLNIINNKNMSRKEITQIQNVIARLLYRIVSLNHQTAEVIADLHLKSSEHTFQIFCELLFQSIYDKIVMRKEAICLDQTSSITSRLIHHLCEVKRGLSIFHICLEEHILNLSLSEINLNYITTLLTVAFHLHQSMMKSDLSVTIIIDVLIYSKIPVFTIISAIDRNFIDYFDKSIENFQINILITFLKNLLIYEISQCYHLDKIPGSLSVVGQQFWLADNVTEHPKLMIVSYLKDQLVRNPDSIYLINHLYLAFLNRSK